ncbi:MAG TPA: type 1 glutamine amidotransferase domain-containing protein [Telluria sp.]
MNVSQRLAGKRIAVLAADGFEKVELMAPIAALAQEGAEIVVMALHRGRIRGMHVHQPADLVRVDKIVSEARAQDYDGLLIPGGYISPDLLRQSAPARAFVRDMNALGKPIAVMSQAPVVLTSAGLAAGRALTSSPGVRDDMVNAGATWLNEEVVRDANLLSSRSAEDMTAFLRDMVPLFAGESEISGLPRQAYSDPQREEPSQTPGQPLRWLSTPAVGTMLSLALLGVGVVAANRGRRKKQSLLGEIEPPRQLE